MGSIVLPTQVSLPPSMCDCFLPEKCVLKCISKLQIRQFTYLIQPLQPVDFPELNQPAGYNPFNPKGYNPISGLNATLVVPAAKDEQVLDQHTQAASCSGKIIWVVYLLPLVES